MPAYHRYRGGVVLAALGLSCGPRPGSAGPHEAICDERLPPITAELRPAPAIDAPSSQIAVAVIARPRAVAREIERQVPAVLADVRRQPVGAPGEASYRVRRGPFGVALDRDRLFVTTAVVADIEVCKPFGALCIRYGTCNPELAATVSIPAALGRDYAIGRARASIDLRRPCYILGNDVSEPIRNAARDQIAQIERRVNSALPDLRAPLAQAWQLLKLPLALGPGTCVRIEPERVVQEMPRMTEGAIITEFGLHGRVRVERPCAAAEAPGTLRALPELEQVPDAGPGLMLRVPIRVGWSEVSAELSRSLASRADKPAKVRIVNARARAGSRGREGVVAIETTLQGPVCGDATWLAEPWYNPLTSRVHLRKVALAPPHEPLAELLEEYGLDRAIEEDASMALPVDVSSAPDALRDLVRRAGASLPRTLDVNFEVKPPQVDRVLPEADGLVAVATLTGAASVTLK